jgi:hypothetical protein
MESIAVQFPQHDQKKLFDVQSAERDFSRISIFVHVHHRIDSGRKRIGTT